MTAYPAAIYCDYPPFDGWSVIAQGHNLTPEQIAAAVEESAGPGCVPTVTKEEHFYHKPRIIHCGNHGTIGCDDDGMDWHGHWFALKENPDPKTHFTVIGYEYEPTP
jgi:hypothetical protein